MKNHKAIGYVTKYLMKEIERERRGVIEEQRVVSVPVATPDGRLEHEQQIVTLERLCRAHRIRYSKHFFPERTADLRRKLFGEKDEETQEKTSQEDSEQEPESEEAATPSVRQSPWMLYEVEQAKDDREAWERRRGIAQAGVARSPDREETAVEAYQRMKREALVEALTGLRDGKRLYSRRVVSIWSYQRERLRVAS